LCPFKNEVDIGSVQVEFTVGATTFELHSLADYFRIFEQETISHEALTDRIFYDLSGQGIAIVQVVTEWNTAGMPVSVERS
jgi:NADPH-dependent 7-cyano-7-deazaguanine reductase QueF